MTKNNTCIGLPCICTVLRVAACHIQQTELDVRAWLIKNHDANKNVVIFESSERIYRDLSCS